MGDTDNIMDAAEARNLIINFFTSIEKKEELFNNIIQVLKNKDYFFYIYNDKDRFEAFKDCIVFGHFQWILDVTNNQIETEFDSKYSSECSVSNKIYINFYEIFNDTISNSNHFSKRAKRLLSKYAIFLSE